MPKRSSKKPRDVNALAAHIVAEATGEPDEGKNPAAVALGKLGGKVGGKARAKALSPERRKQIAQDAANARWKNKASSTTTSAASTKPSRRRQPLPAASPITFGR